MANHTQPSLYSRVSVRPMTYRGGRVVQGVVRLTCGEGTLIPVQDDGLTDHHGGGRVFLEGLSHCHGGHEDAAFEVGSSSRYSTVHSTVTIATVPLVPHLVPVVVVLRQAHRVHRRRVVAVVYQ